MTRGEFDICAKTIRGSFYNIKGYTTCGPRLLLGYDPALPTRRANDAANDKVESLFYSSVECRHVKIVVKEAGGDWAALRAAVVVERAAKQHSNTDWATPGNTWSNRLVGSPSSSTKISDSTPTSEAACRLQCVRNVKCKRISHYSGHTHPGGRCFLLSANNDAVNPSLSGWSTFDLNIRFEAGTTAVEPCQQQKTKCPESAGESRARLLPRARCTARHGRHHPPPTNTTTHARTHTRRRPMFPRLPPRRSAPRCRRVHFRRVHHAHATCTSRRRKRQEMVHPGLHKHQTLQVHDRRHQM